MAKKKATKRAKAKKPKTIRPTKRTWRLARKYYETHKVTKTQVADKYLITRGTLFRKSREEKWAPAGSRQPTNSEKKTPKRFAQAVAEDMVEEAANTRNHDNLLNRFDLTDGEREFVELFCVYNSATKAYALAYHISHSQARGLAHKVMLKDEVVRAIEALKRAHLKSNGITGYDIVDRLREIAFADVGDFEKWGSDKMMVTDNKNNPVCNEDGLPIYERHNWIELTDSKLVNTGLVDEITNGKDGPHVKLLDRYKALQMLWDMLGDAGISKQRKLAADAKLAEVAAEQAANDDHGKQTIKIYNEWGQSGDDTEKQHS